MSIEEKENCMYIRDEDYDPKKHCCRSWWLDFCECVHTRMRKEKKERRDKNVSNTLKFLAKNNLKHKLSKTPNVVAFNYKDKVIYLSLKKQHGCFKVRYEGRNKWYTYKTKKFKETFCD